MDFKAISFFTAILGALLSVVISDVQHNPQIVPSHNQQQSNQPISMQQRPAGQRSSFRDKTHIQDKDHIMEHLEEVIEKPESEMTEAELQLHYFKMHDYDNNNQLDGLELIKALTHFHRDKEDENEVKKKMTEDELIALIDPIFKDEDENVDGYIDYPEYANAQT